MATMTGDFSGEGTALAKAPWFPARMEWELGAMAGSGAGVREVLDIGPTTRFPRPNFLGVQVALESKRLPGTLYAVELVLPTNWPWGEPVCYVLEPAVTSRTRVDGHHVPHVYSGDPFGDCLCTHVARWDTGHGRSSLGAYLFAVAVWLGCFEEFLRRPAEMGYGPWAEYATQLMRKWKEGA